MISKENLHRLRQKIKTERPLVHCITNHISINDCANALLALGAKPIMAEHKDEVADITASAKALAVNLGNISDSRLAAISVSGDTAKKLGIPCIIDLVGVGCSRLRLDFASDFIERCSPAIIKGNESELRAICGLPHHAEGIDNGEKSLLCDTVHAAETAAKKFGCTVLMSGKNDVIADKNGVYICQNGHELMSFVTGTGCMLNAVAGAFLSVGTPLEAAAAAAIFMGLSGEYASAGFEQDKSISRFHGALIDGLFVIDEKYYSEKARIFKYEKA
ncbi:MAG: hydroxyethylthiazole kinase [Oscillospiraceae bacterium]